MLTFVGDCRTILDESNLFSDATDMAQAIERSKTLDNGNFTIGIDGNLLWLYNKETDIHYFYLIGRE